MLENVHIRYCDVIYCQIFLKYKHKLMYAKCLKIGKLSQILLNFVRFKFLLAIGFYKTFISILLRTNWYLQHNTGLFKYCLSRFSPSPDRPPLSPCERKWAIFLWLLYFDSLLFILFFFDWQMRNYLSYTTQRAPYLLWMTNYQTK